MLEVAAGGDERTGGDGVAQARLLRAFGLALRAAEQRHVARRHAVRDTAEALLVLGAQDRAACHGETHAGIETPRGQRRLAKGGAGRSIGGQGRRGGRESVDALLRAGPADRPGTTRI